MFTLDDVREIFKELDDKTGLHGAELGIYNVNSFRVLGKLDLRGTDKDGYIPHHFEFSDTLLDKRNGYELFREVVIHEYCHYVATVRHGTDCQHDERFAEVCHELADNEEQARRIDNGNGTEIKDEIWDTYEEYVEQCQEVIQYGMDFIVDYKHGILTGYVDNFHDVTINEINLEIVSSDEDDMLAWENITLANIKPQEEREFKFNMGDMANYVTITVDFKWFLEEKPVVYTFTKQTDEMTEFDVKEKYSYSF